MAWWQRRAVPVDRSEVPAASGSSAEPEALARAREAAVSAVVLEGDELVAAVGESFYQPALRRCCGSSGGQDVGFDCEAVLMREPDNPYDANAVAVYAGGEKVAHLSRPDAEAWQPILQILAEHGHVAVCSAMIAGRAPDSDADTTNLGIFLHLPERDDALEQVCAELRLEADEFYL